MFGNKLCYTFSPGGMRRGLIYQSNDVGKGAELFRLYTTQYNYTVGWLYFVVSEKNKLFAGIDLRSDTLKTSASITNNKFPVAVVPDMKIKINGHIIDTSQLSSLLQLPSYLSAQHKTVTYKDTANQNALLSFDATVIYYDVTNVPVVSGRYDIPYTPPLEFNVLINNVMNLNGRNTIEWELPIGYKTDWTTNYNFNGPYYTDLSDVNFGKTVYDCSFDFVEQYGNYYVQNFTRVTTKLTGASPIMFKNYAGDYMAQIIPMGIDGYETVGNLTGQFSAFVMNVPTKNTMFDINNVYYRAHLFNDSNLKIESANDFSLTKSEAQSAHIYYDFYSWPMLYIPNTQYQLNSLNEVLTPY